MEVHIFDTAHPTQFECQVPLVCVVTVVHLVGTNISDQNAACIFRLYCLGGDSISSWNVGTHLPDYLVSSPLKSILLPFTSLQISICLPLWIFKK